MHRHIILPALVVLLAGPGIASAQVVGASGFTRAGFTEVGVGTLLINAEECAEGLELAFTYDLDVAPSADQSVEIFTSAENDCEPETEQLDSRTTQNGTFTLNVPGDFVDSCDNLDGEVVYVCVRLVSGETVDDTSESEDVTLDTIAPDAPDTVTVTGGDGNLRVSWGYEDGAADAESFKVYYRRVDDGGDFESEGGGTGTSHRITGLANDVEYEVYVVAVDEAGNESEDSLIVTGTPMATTDFWERYRERGGPPATGCTTGAGPAGLALLLVLAFLPALRRRQALGYRKLLGAALVALMALPSVAQAQGEALEESRNWWVEAALGPYQPRVDDDFSDPGPYEELFGNDNQLLWRLRVERTVAHFIGQVGIGVGAGFSRASGMSLTADGEASEDFTRFFQVPLELFATYRFDYAALNWGVPLAAFARAGVVYELWWSTTPSGTAEFDGDSARGARPGFTYGGGLMLHLDALDPSLAADFQRSSGVDNSYLFWEWTQMDVDGWGDDSGIDLTDYTWTAGLAIEF